MPIPCGERLARVTPSAQAGCSLAAGEACRKKTRQVARAVHSPVSSCVARGLGIDVASYGPVTDTVVRRNRISDAGEDGLAVRLVRKKLKRTQVRRNHVFHSGDDGIDVASASTTLTRNEADRNAHLGTAAVRDVIDGGGNRASGNGDPRQCTHIVCR